MSGLLGGRRSQAQQRPQVSGLQLQTSAYGAVVPIVYGTARVSPNLVWYGDFAMTAVPSSPPASGKGGATGGGGKGGGGSTQYDYSAAVALGLCEGPGIAGIGQVWANKTVTSLAALNLSFFAGAYPQAPWSYLTTNHAGQDLGYSGLAYVAGAPYQLGNSAQLPNHSFEVQGVFCGSVAGQADADPSLVVADLLANPHYGAGFPAARLDDFSTYQDYCLATGLLISPAYASQTQAASLLDDIAAFTNSAFVWSSGVLSLVPYGDETVTGNGRTYTPPLAPLYDLTDDDFLANGTGDPVVMTRKRPSDAMNSVRLEFLNRASQYNPEIVDAKDQAMIDLYGLRAASSRQAHLFADAAAARQSAQLLLQRQAVRNLYRFTLDQRYVLLDPMDIVTVTDANLGLARQWVRITEIAEDEGGNLTVTAEEYLGGTGSAAEYGFAQGAGYAANYDAAPGDALAPVIFEAPVQIATAGLEVWLATAGGASWGGCDVHVSSDGSTYRLAGRKHGPSRMGVLSAGFPAGADPDTADTLAVDLSESAGVLLSGTQADADLAHTLCHVDGEYVSYETATLTGTSRYALGTYLRRGLYGSAIAGHAVGAAFARLDDGIFKFAYDKSEIGRTVYVKLASFNAYGGGAQTLAEVAAYAHVIQGPPPPSNVAGFTAQQNGGTVVFAWGDVADFALKGYDILYGPQGGGIGDATFLTESARGTEMTNAAVPPGTWTFHIRARDIADQFSPVPATVDLVVTNPNPVIASIPQEPDWPGTLDNLHRHWTGVLVPLSTRRPADYADFTPFDAFVPDPVAAASYTAPLIDTGFDDTLRVWAGDALALGPGETGQPAAGFAIDTWLTGATDPGTWMPWTLGTAGMRYLKARLSLSPVAGNVAFVAGFTPTIDRAPKIESSAASVTVAAGGTAIAFPSPYHADPLVLLTVVGAGALLGVAADITPTGFTAHVYDSAGDDVGGTINWSATGE